jgi:hypothetical protein
MPTVAVDPLGPLSAAYIALGQQVAAQQWLKNKMTHAPSSIVMMEE